MTRGMGILFAFAAMCIICAGCDDDGFSTSMVPESPLGLIFEDEQSTASDGPQLVPAQDEYLFLLMWLDGPVGTDMHNVYRKDGDSTYIKLNTEVVRRGRIFGIPFAPVGLGYVDFTFRIDSIEPYSYRVAATNTQGRESGPSEAITLVPADIDPSVVPTNLMPDHPYRISRTPTFSWDPVPGAAGYCLALLEEMQYYGDIPKWIYFTNKTSVRLDSTDGVAYADGVGRRLLPDTDYSWIVWAVNSNNIGYAANFADFSTTSHVATVLDTTLFAGERSTVWNQIDYNGAQTPPGDYELRFSAAGYDTTLDFQIFAVGTDADAGLGGPVQLPTRTSVWMETYTHSLGADIEIFFTLPAQTAVRMEVFAK